MKKDPISPPRDSVDATAAIEANFDGLVGPTHHYAGLSHGNVASTSHGGEISNPKAAALQGLKKAAFLRNQGLRQGILPPLRRPRLDVLRALGFSGSEADMLKHASFVPKLLSAVYSASSMWTANAATVSPSADTADGKVHFTPANLVSKFHRSLEPAGTGENLKRIFPGPRFVHHAPVNAYFGDEGAANHGRLAPAHGSPGVEVFVFGGSRLNEAGFPQPKKFPARQSIEASHAVASLHGLDFSRAMVVQQSPEAIDAGVFHNDVISVMNENVFFGHESAFASGALALREFQKKWDALGTDRKLEFVTVTEKEVPIADVVKSYLFNSQLLTLPTGGMALVCPEECRDTKSVHAAMKRIQSEHPWLKTVHYFDLRQSMNNGGGPACLRLRVVLTKEEEAAVHPGVWLTPELEKKLETWIGKHYRDRLSADDLADPALIGEVNAAYDELERILGIPLA